MDKVWVTGVQTGGKSVILRHCAANAMEWAIYANCDYLSRDLDFFLIVLLLIYDYI